MNKIKFRSIYAYNDPDLNSMAFKENIVDNSHQGLSLQKLPNMSHHLSWQLAGSELVTVLRQDVESHEQRLIQAFNINIYVCLAQ